MQRASQSDLAHASLEGADVQGLIASGGEALQLAENVAAAPFRVGKQPSHDLLPLSFNTISRLTPHNQKQISRRWNAFTGMCFLS